jgi:DNA repair exonuclease SbcCD nuclease subunit
MKFAHLADIHLGGWRQEEMQALNLKAFQKAIDECIKEKVEFIIFAGDLFDTAIPSIDTLKEAMSEFKKLNEARIKCYIVSGSHDYSATGKTFLDVIERAGFCKNISCIQEEQEGKICIDVIDDKDIIFVGLPGKKASAEVDFFKKLKINGNLDKNKLKIFVFHSTLTEAKPEGMDFVESVDSKDLPEGFDYYAGGHLHIIFDEKKQNSETQASVVYPGPVFPNNIDELEKLNGGSFYILESQGNKITKKEKKDIKLKESLVINMNLDNLSSENANLKILSDIEKLNLNDVIFVLRIKGTLSSGKTSDIDWKKISEKVKEKGVYSFLKSASGLTTQEFKLDIKAESQNIDEIEKQFITKYKEESIGDFKNFSDLIVPLFSALETEKQESEKKENFERRVFDEVKKILGVE